MKQIAQYQDGRLELQEVPRPGVPVGGILVRTTHSVISLGTERMKIEQARMNLLLKARARPDQVRKVLDTARNLGWRSAWEKVRNRLETPTPLGYSAAGVVEQVDKANTRFRVGDRVTCGGAECAFHAEYLAIPDLLAAKIPDGVTNWQAAYTTVAAIALQVVRQLEPRLGDRVMVVGQGLIGLLVTALLRANGARVLALEVDPSRRSVCAAMGAEVIVVHGEQDLADEVRSWTEGFGVDSAVIGTATSSNAPVEQAAEVLRDRGRIVVVGNTQAQLDWKVFYRKEIEVRYSRSYGPGRYDPTYEWGGSDYPIGYVRWTEQRNFEACLQLMRSGVLDVGALTTRRVPFEKSLEVYAKLGARGSTDIGVVLEYAEPESTETAKEGAAPERRVTTGKAPSGPVKPRPDSSRVTSPIRRLDVIGAGNFARTMLLPHLQGQLDLGIVVNHTSLSAEHVKTKFGFASATTQADAVFADSTENTALMIATRHHLHAALVCRGLAKHRQVFVEKPLCLTREELDEIDQARARSQGEVMVGFNRRFAPASVALQTALQTVPGPKVISIRVRPGVLDPEHWHARPEESGGRVLGDACHYFDYFGFLLGCAPRRILAQTVWPTQGRLPFPDCLTAQVEFADGSCGQLIHTGEGDTAFPKEVLTVYGAGMVAELVNFQTLTLYRQRKRKRLTFASKGHAEEMKAWMAYLGGDTPHPLPYPIARESMLLTFAALESIGQSQAVELPMAPVT